MKALTLHAPWAWAIAHGPKRVENRTWKPPSALLGQRIAIHAGKNLGTISERESCILALLNAGVDPPDEWPRGRVLCAARLLGWISLDGSLSGDAVRHACDSEWYCGPIGWVLDTVQAVVQLAQLQRSAGSLGLGDIVPGPRAVSLRAERLTDEVLSPLPFCSK